MPGGRPQPPIRKRSMTVQSRPEAFDTTTDSLSARDCILCRSPGIPGGPLRPEREGAAEAEPATLREPARKSAARPAEEPWSRRVPPAAFAGPGAYER